MMRAAWRIAILAGSLLATIVPPASAAVFLSERYYGQVFTSGGGGPFGWTFESSGGGVEMPAVAYRLSTDPPGAWHRCDRFEPVTVSLSNLPPGTYGIEVTNDYVYRREVAPGEEIINTVCTTKSEPKPQEPRISDSFTIAAPIVEQPGSLVTTRTENNMLPTLTGTSTTPTGASGVPLAPSPAPTSHGCRAGYTVARIGGRSTCLHAGQPCKAHYGHVYRRYHLACVRKGHRFRLVRLRG